MTSGLSFSYAIKILLSCSFTPFHILVYFCLSSSAYLPIYTLKVLSSFVRSEVE